MSDGLGGTQAIQASEDARPVSVVPYPAGDGTGMGISPSIYSDGLRFPRYEVIGVPDVSWSWSWLKEIKKNYG